MLADLVRFNREARELVGANGAGGSLRDFCARRGYSEYFVERLIVPQASAVWSADPEQLSAFPASFLAEFLDNHGSLQIFGRPALALDRRRLAGATSRRWSRAFARPHSGGDARPQHPPRTRPRRRRDGCRHRVLRRGGGRGALRPGAGDARRPERGRARGAGRDPLPAQRGRRCTPTRACCRAAAAPGRAGTSTSRAEGEAARRGGAHDRHLRHEHPAAARGRPRVPRHPEQDRRDRPRRSHPHDELQPPGLHRRDGRGPGALGARSAAGTATHYCGAYWGWGFHEDGVRSALRAASRRARFHEPPDPDRARGCRSRRWPREPPPRSTRGPWPTGAASRSSTGSPIPLFMTLLDLDELPEALDPPSALVGAPSGARPLPRRGTTWPRARRAPARPRPSSPPAPAGLPPRALRAAPRPARCGCSAMPRMLGVRLQPGQLPLPLRRGRRDRRSRVIAEVTNTPWGDRHAYVGAPRRREGGPIRARFGKRLHVSPSTRWTSPTSSRSASPATRSRSRSATGTGADGVRRRPGAATPRAEPRGDDQGAARLPARGAGALARIYSHGLRLKLKGVPHHPPPRGRGANRVEIPGWPSPAPLFGDYYREIYAKGMLAGERPAQPIAWAELEASRRGGARRARRRLRLGRRRHRGHDAREPRGVPPLADRPARAARHLSGATSAPTCSAPRCRRR